MYRAIRVYIAGAYSADNVMDLFVNMKIGIETSTRVFEAGLSPFSPWLDYHFILSAKEPLDVTDFYRYSEAWLDVSDAVLVVDNPKNLTSKGLEAELIRAKHLHKPIFNSLDRLLDWAEMKRKEALLE